MGSCVRWMLVFCAACGGAAESSVRVTPDVVETPAVVASPPLEIVRSPIPFARERKELTAAYLQKHTVGRQLTGDLDADVSMVPRMIVLHWTAGKTSQGAWNTFAPTRLPNRPDLQKASMLNVSAHFVVDQDGTVWRLMPDNLVARHVIGLNHLSIGVENVGGGPGLPLTSAQVQANIALVRHLREAWPSITHLVGHMEYRRFEGHPYFRESDPDYRTTKVDPGVTFMTAVRAGVADLALDGPP
ncbi:MAG: N-acetylmuramoyl-L-alanine amidase [Kiritimatiellia bacterium]|jgi:N-acetylmuramoyl-L-alanine amidase